MTNKATETTTENDRLLNWFNEFKEPGVNVEAFSPDRQKLIRDIQNDYAKFMKKAAKKINLPF